MTSLACDDWIMVIGFSSGLAKVHSLDTGLFLDLLNCRWDQYDLATPLEPVWVSVEVGEHLVVTGTSDGVVMVRNKGNMGAFYKDAPHGDTTVLVLKVSYTYQCTPYGNCTCNFVQLTPCEYYPELWKLDF